MRIFLTGGTYFIGSHFLKEALNSGNEIYALKRNKNSICKIKLDQEPVWINSNLENVKSEHLIDIDVLIHLAAHSANYPYDSLENCLQYNLTVL